MPPRGNGATALAERPTSKDALAQLEQVVIRGDLASLTDAERIGYYARVTESLGINPLTRPFEYISLNGRMVLYARKDATDQLRKINGISIDRLERERDDALGLAIVTAYGSDRSGRTDSSLGAVSIAGLKGEAMANALMKAETKAKRRMTLSLAGLGWLDESEVGSVEEGPVESRPVAATRRQAVAQRLAALPDPDAKTPAEEKPVETVLDVDDIPFSEPRSTSSGDPWMRKLHAAGADRGMDHADLHELAVSAFQVGSLTDLTPVQRADMMESVETRPKLPFVDDRPDRPPVHPRAFRSDADSTGTETATEAAVVGEASPGQPAAATPASDPIPPGTPAPATFDEVLDQVWQTAVDAGRVERDSGDWAPLYALAREVYPGREVDDLDETDWLAIRAVIAGEKPEPVGRPRGGS